MAQSAIKTPIEVKDYTIDWQPTSCTPPLAQGETIASSVWDTDGAIDILINSPAPTQTDTTTTVWISGGTANNIYTITNTITTSQGRTFQDSFNCYVNHFNSQDCLYC